MITVKSKGQTKLVDLLAAAQPRHLVDQALLAHPPLSPSTRMFFLSALGIAGRYLYGKDWRDADKHALRLDEPVLGVPPVLPVPREPQRPDEMRPFPMSLVSPTATGETDADFQARKARAAEAHAEWERKVESVRQINAQNEEQHIPRHEAAIARYNANLPLAQMLLAVRDHILQLALDGLPLTIQWTDRIRTLSGPAIASAREQVTLLQRGLIRLDNKDWTVFVDAETLKRACPVAPAVDAPAEIEPAELSKYLRLALHVHKLGFGPSFKGLKKEVRRALVDAAPLFGLALSTEQEEYLATFLRNEDAQRGKNKLGES